MGWMFRKSPKKCTFMLQTVFPHQQQKYSPSPNLWKLTAHLWRGESQTLCPCPKSQSTRGVQTFTRGYTPSQNTYGNRKSPCLTGNASTQMVGIVHCHHCHSLICNNLNPKINSERKTPSSKIPLKPTSIPSHSKQSNGIFYIRPPERIVSKMEQLTERRPGGGALCSVFF